MKKDYIKIQAFEFSTPKYLGKSFDPDRYDHEQVEYLIKQILNITSLKDRAFHKNSGLLFLSI